MKPKQSWQISVVVLYLSLLLSGNAMDREPVRGTGNISISVVTRKEEPLDPPCVVLVMRVLDLTYTGIIQSLGTDRAADTVVVNRCVDTPEGAFSRIDTLDEVMIAGRKGGVTIEVKGTFVGDVRSPAGVRTGAHLTIRGVTGELKGIRGHGLFVGRTSLTEGFNTYWFEIQFNDAKPEERRSHP